MIDEMETIFAGKRSDVISVFYFFPKFPETRLVKWQQFLIGISDNPVDYATKYHPNTSTKLYHYFNPLSATALRGTQLRRTSFLSTNSVFVNVLSYSFKISMLSRSLCTDKSGIIFFEKKTENIKLYKI